VSAVDLVTVIIVGLWSVAALIVIVAVAWALSRWGR
jgi:hypothetical protein